MVFSGIVECQGEIVTLTFLNNCDNSSGTELVVRPLMDDFMNEDISLGCSIAVNGTCLTVTKFDSKVCILKPLCRDHDLDLHSDTRSGDFGQNELF